MTTGMSGIHNYDGSWNMNNWTCYPLVNVYKTMKRSNILKLGKSSISMAIFNNYVRLPDSTKWVGPFHWSSMKLQNTCGGQTLAIAVATASVWPRQVWQRIATSKIEKVSYMNNYKINMATNSSALLNGFSFNLQLPVVQSWQKHQKTSAPQLNVCILAFPKHDQTKNMLGD